MALAPILQNGFVVRDLDAALRFWTGTMGVGPFYVFEPVVLTSRTSSGAPREVRIAAAFAYSGDMQIELIVPLDDAPSPYAEFLSAGREGLHHIAFACDDVAREAARLGERGFSEVFAFHSPAGAGVYLEPDVRAGVLVELLSFDAAMQPLFARIRAASQGWNGERPVRGVRA